MLKKSILILLFTFSFSLFTLQYCVAQIINTYAGNYSLGAGYSGDGGPATAAQLSHPVDVAFDKKGNLYIADRLNNVIRKVDTSGVITTIAGNGVAGYSGDGGPATAAEFNQTVGILIDSVGDMYISDEFNSVVRKIYNSTGIITTIAGTKTFGYSGNGGPATAAQLNLPSFTAMDKKGNLLICDFENRVIREVNTNGIIYTVAGDTICGYSGDGGPATAAEVCPEGVTVDNNGNLFITDPADNVIRKVNTSGIISTIAGNSIQGYSGDGGPATSAEFNEPSGVTVDASSNIFIADELNNVIRMIDTSGIIYTIVGNHIKGFSGDGGPATAAEMYYESAVAFDASGNMFIADEYNNVVRKVTGLNASIFQFSVFSFQFSQILQINN